MIYEAAMSDAEDKLDTIYRFMVAGFHYGAHVVGFSSGTCGYADV